MRNFFLIVWELMTQSVIFGETFLTWQNLPRDPGSQDPTFCGLCIQLRANWSATATQRSFSNFQHFCALFCAMRGKK